MVSQGMKQALLAGLILAAALGSSGCASGPHRTPAQRQADAQIASQVSGALNGDSRIYARHIEVRVENGVAYLGGYVWSDLDLFRAKELAAGVPGVKNVVDNMELERGGRDNSPVSR